MHFNWQCSRDGERCGTIGIGVANDHVRLIYTWTRYGSDPRHFDYHVWIGRAALPLRWLSALVSMPALSMASRGDLRNRE
jgi:hypothetical protein